MIELIAIGLGAAILGAVLAWLVLRPELVRADFARDAAMAEAAAARAAGDAARTEAGELANLLEGTKLKAERSGTLAERVPLLETELAEVRAARDQLAGQIAEMTARLEASEAAHRDKMAALTSLRGEIEERLKTIASDALHTNQTRFIEVANQVLERQREGAAAELEERRKSVEATVLPITETLGRYEAAMARLEQERMTGLTTLSAEIKMVNEGQGQVRAETQRLVNALRAAPKTRGRWGEMQLQNILELSGLKLGVDYSVEASHQRDDDRLRPDVILNLPGGRHIIVDAKTPMSGYLDSLEAVDEVERERHLKAHAQQLRAHMKQLAAKDYHVGLVDTVDFVALFVPGENLFAAAVERDPALLTDAIEAGVVIVTPVTLMALAKVVAFGWRQERLTQNAKVVHDLGRELYRRLQGMGDQVADLGKHLDRGVKKYNEFVGSLESRIMPSARRFVDLGVAGDEAALPEPTSVDTVPRQPRRDRDLTFTATPEG